MLGVACSLSLATEHSRTDKESQTGDVTLHQTHFLYFLYAYSVALYLTFIIMSYFCLFLRHSFCIVGGSLRSRIFIANDSFPVICMHMIIKTLNLKHLQYNFWSQHYCFQNFTSLRPHFV